MALEKFTLKEGQPTSNRIRYWAFKRMHELDTSNSGLKGYSLSARHVFNFMNGECQITLGKLDELCRLLRCDVMELVRPLPEDLPLETELTVE